LLKRGKNSPASQACKTKPVYAAQIALYQAYMESQIPGIATNPALFTAINKDTAELYFEWVPFNGEFLLRRIVEIKPYHFVCLLFH
jgi:hypothetical protein